MKRAFAVFFVLLVGWMQTTAATSALQIAVPAPCTCCGCAQPACCVTQSAPVSQSRAPAVPTRSTVDKQISVAAVTPVLWVLSDAPARQLPLADISPLLAAGRPLYERHCALLI